MYIPPVKLYDIDAAAQDIRPRPVDGNKRTFGTALIIAGSKTVGGCAILAAKACLRSGVGKVVLHVPDSLRTIVMTAVPEAVISISDSAYPDYLTNLPTGHFDAVAIGPGIGFQDTTKRTVLQCLEQYATTPIIVDADALRIIAEAYNEVPVLPNTLFTPHLGELEALQKESISDYDSASVALRLSSKYTNTIIAKGHPSFIASSKAIPYTIPTGSDAIATAGSGDVLTGILVGLAAQGYNLEVAARLGAFLHGLAGDKAAEDLGHHSVIASDIIRYLPKAFQAVEQHNGSHL